MYPLLSAYLYQEKKISIPGVGQFELHPVNASTSFEAVAAPGWEIRFTENPAVTASENPDGLYDFLGAQETINKEDARQQFEELARNILVKLNDRETVEWVDVGNLEKPGSHIVFTPAAHTLSPFTGIAAQKVIREHARHQVLVGEKETSSDVVKEQLQELKAKKNNVQKMTWIVLAAVALIAAAFFFKNGCNIRSAANQQKASIQKTPETYKLK
ncbi:hypothetical protein [Niabella aurantiaca]|uniref:hypothetical protein n=1 Tax=Niabella aurantiaca TaxID=379900 RepID=UPI00035C111B|nr:hypothetical protein [Niabella aurantiaca]